MKETGMFCSGKSEWSGHGHGVARSYGGRVFLR